MKQNGPPKLVAGGKQFPFVVLSHQSQSGFWWSVNFIAKLIEIIEKYFIDTTQIYLTKKNMGGYEIWQFAGEYPEQFAAIAPFAAGGLFVVPIW